MLPLSARDLVRFTPSALDLSAADSALAQARAADPPDPAAIDAAQARVDTVRAALESHAGDPPVYLLKPATVMERAAFRRDVHATGARYHDDAALLDCLRDGIKALVDDTQKPELLAVIDAVEELRAAAPSTPSAADVKTLADFDEIESTLRQHWPRYAQMTAERAYWITVAPIIACRHFLRGWENRRCAFIRKAGLVAEDSLALLDETELMEIGFKAMALMQPSRDQEKNSVSPSRSG